jgi:hypothetical protein
VIDSENSIVIEQITIERIPAQLVLQKNIENGNKKPVT